MKILLISTARATIPPRAHGPTEQFVGHLVPWLSQRGHDVTVFTTGDSQPGCRKKWCFEIAGSAGKDYARHIEAAVEEARYGGYEIVQNYEAMPIAIEGLAKAGVNSVTQMMWLGDARLRTYFLSLNREARAARRMLPVSRAQARRLRYMQPLDPIHYGILVSDFSFGRVPDDYLLFLGNITPGKGPDIAVQAALQLGMNLVIAGPIWPRWLPYFNERIAPYIDGQQIRWLGEADSSMKKELLSRARALVLPLRHQEPFGIVMIEAMASGTPVIATDRGAVREIITDGVVGLVARSRNDFMEAMQHIDELSRQACRDHVERNFSLDRVGRRLERLYASLIESNISD